MSSDNFTVGDLRRNLAGLPDDMPLTFGGGLLTFYRVKHYDDDVNIEFGEAQAFMDEAFRKRNPHVKVAYIDMDYVHWDESGVVGSVDVGIR